MPCSELTSTSSRLAVFSDLLVDLNVLEVLEHAADARVGAVKGGVQLVELLLGADDGLRLAGW